MVADLARVDKRYCTAGFPVTHIVWQEDGKVRFVPGGDVESCFRAAIVQTLAEVGPLLRVCANERCERFFVRQGRQTYCKPACSQRVRTELHRKRHAATASAKRRGRYAAKQRRRLGQKVKVGRKAK